MNVYSDKPPLYYTCTTCHKCFSHTVSGKCPYCEIGRLTDDNAMLDDDVAILKRERARWRELAEEKVEENTKLLGQNLKGVIKAWNALKTTRRKIRECV